jgi:hypothetical protein
VAGALSVLSCATGQQPAVISRYAGPLSEDERRSAASLPYSPSDVAVAWLDDDSLLVAHMEIYRAVDALAGTCAGSGFFKVSARGGAPRAIALGEPACGATRTLPGASSSGDAVVFAVPADRGLRFARLDLASLRVDTLRTGCVSHRYPAVARSGALAWSSCGMGEDGIFVWADAAPRARLVSGPGQVAARFPSWSPDGTRVVYSVGSGTRVLATADTNGVSRLLGVPGDTPSWSPDGSWIAFLTGREYPCLNGVAVMRPDGSDVRQVFTNEVTTTYSVGQGPAREGQTCGPIVWSPASQALVFPRYFVGGESLWRLEIASGRLGQVTAPDR